MPVPEERIERAILLFRGEKVMLDADLAALYGVATRVLVQAVKRNIERFPPDFMFQLTKEEVDLLRLQFVTSKSASRLNQGESEILRSQFVISKITDPPGWATLPSVCLHRARGGHALQRAQFTEGHCGEHRNHADLYPLAPNAGFPCRPGPQAGSPGKEIRCPV